MADELLTGSSMYDENYFVNPLLRKAWEGFKKYWVSNPYKVTSVFRSPGVNDSVGGVPNSYHLTGSALDVDLNDNDLREIENMIFSGNHNFYKWILDNNVCEFIVYKTHVHFAVDSSTSDVYISVRGKSVQESNKFLAQLTDSVNRRVDFWLWFTLITITATGIMFRFTIKNRLR